MGCILKGGGGLNARLVVGAVLLAAGAGERMGRRPKCLLELGGVPLIRRTLFALSGAGVDEVAVVLGHHADRIEPVVQDFPVTIVRNPAPDDGQVSSQRIGLAALSSRIDAVLVVLADQPLLQAGDIAALIGAWKKRPAGAEVVHPQVDGERGNPVLFSAAVREQILAGAADAGCRQWQARHPDLVAPFVTDCRRYRVDVDTPADLERFARETGHALRWPSGRMTTLGVGMHALWPTPIGVHRIAGAAELNPLLVRVFGALRALQQARRAQPPGAFFASDDDLVQRVQLPEWRDFVAAVVACLRDTASAANAGAWPPATELRIALAGMWFQCSNGGAFHDLHTHGNCSWSGVYMVQVDAAERRVRHPVHGPANGATRFYGPPFAALAGAHVDLGNAWLQPPHHDVEPVAGQLVVFPSWLAHQALPYDGEVERIVVSFNAGIHAAHGSDRLHAYGH